MGASYSGSHPTSDVGLTADPRHRMLVSGPNQERPAKGDSCTGVSQVTASMEGQGGLGQGAAS